MVKRAFTWGGIAFVAFFIGFRAGVFHLIGAGILSVFEAFGEFFNAMSSS